MIANDTLLSLFNSPVRSITAKVELYNGSTLAATYSYKDALKSFSIERVGEENKFFGFGVCQKLHVKLRDIERVISVTTAHSIKVYFNNVITTPTFYVTESHRDENTNELSITAYDAIYAASKHTFSELVLTAPYTIGDVAVACRKLLGLNGCAVGTDASWQLSYEDSANFDGAETIREVLNCIADATQTIYYVNSKNNLQFKRLDKDGAAVLTIDRAKYFTLDSSTNRRLVSVCHATELGDNVTASMEQSGTTAYIRDNPFWELRGDVATLVENALAAVGGLTINQFKCAWRGNPLLEITDKIALVTKDGSTVISYVLDDVISYNGALSQETRWSYTGSDETASNPTSLGDALKQTYARVDKANKQIDLVASEAASNREAISSLQINTENISASVSKVEENTNNALEAVSGDIATLTSRVEATVTAVDVQLQIKSELQNGVSKVETATGFTFNEEGLRVSKSGSEMESLLDEDGLTVFRDDVEVLTADNTGVSCINVTARQYLIVGDNSRFENYGSNRTGCFWIGG